MPGAEATDRELVLLYVEDEPQTLEPYLQFIREHWSPQSQGVRSCEAAIQLIEEEGFQPHLVIHDCKPTARDDDEVEQIAAGDELYAFLVRQELPIVVLSGESAEDMLRREPYRSDPPMHWFSKPAKRRHFHKAVEILRQSGALR